MSGDLLRFITCGSVDDGKSTLIGRLLHECGALFEDQRQAFEEDSRKWGTQGGEPDYALLLDGLAAEREQSITIDVAYRYFSTGKRKFVVADTPGHEQYTRNMITGASTADVAIILLDAKKGILTQTRRHSYLIHLVGIHRVVLAVNKMDLVNWSAQRFNELFSEYVEFARKIGIEQVLAVPVSALHGDNVTRAGSHSPWYGGPSLKTLLEDIEAVDAGLQYQPLRFPVQWVNRADASFRGFSGLIEAGQIRPGDRVRIQPSGRESTVERLVSLDGDQSVLVAGQSATVTLTDEVDISRGDMISAAVAPAEIADQFECTLVWLADDQMLPGRPYRLQLAASSANATVTALKYRVDVNTLVHEAATVLELNEIAVCNISLDRPVAFEAYAQNRALGGFILIDRISNQTVAAGMLHFALRRAHNIHQQHFDVDMAARALQKSQQPAVLWFTGLSGSGKSTIANEVERQLYAMGRHSYLLDGDNVRHGLNRDLGFTDADRVENIRRVAEVARLMMDAGLIVLTAFISPFRAERIAARQTIGDERFVEVFIDTPLAVAEQRDTKGLYKKARAGELKNFTGIDSPYEPPENPALIVTTDDRTPSESAAEVVKLLRTRGIV